MSVVRRQGVIMVVVLACLLVTSLIGLGLVRLSTMRVRHVRLQQSQLQTAWLADSAVMRAKARLRDDPKYTGETWAIDSKHLGDQGPGEVVIRVTGDGSSGSAITVEARFPLDSPDVTTVTTSATHVSHDSRMKESTP